MPHVSLVEGNKTQIARSECEEDQVMVHAGCCKLKGYCNRFPKTHTDGAICDSGGDIWVLRKDGTEEFAGNIHDEKLALEFDIRRNNILRRKLFVDRHLGVYKRKILPRQGAML